jgi:uncharacterized membrane protein YgcG
MSQSKFDFKAKLDLLKSIRHDIKKKRFILDESKENFGFDNLSLLKKVKNIDEVKGYPFVASKRESKTLKGLKMGVKVVPIETKYEKNEHPSNLEYILLKELTDNIVSKMISPHIAFFLGTQKVANKSTALKTINLKRLEVEDLIRNHSIVLLSEFVESGSLDNWVYNTYEDDLTISDEVWKTIVFQLIYTLAIMQKYYKMMHNDFHYGNILIDTSIKPVGYFVYSINGKKFYIKNNGILAKIWDFEFGMIYSDAIQDFYPNKFIVGRYDYDRKKHIASKHQTKPKHSSNILSDSTTESTVNVPYNYNEIYDLHYFLTSLLDLYISEELFNWILEIYPPELIPKEEKSDSDSSSSSSSSSTSDSDSDSSSSSSSSSSGTSSSSSTSDTSSSSSSDSSRSSSSTSDSDTSSSSYSDSDTSSSSSSTSSSDDTDTSDSDTDASSEISDRYLSDGRMKYGIEDMFDDLPTPLKMLSHPFFQSFTKKPSDFSEETAIYFDAKF